MDLMKSFKKIKDGNANLWDEYTVLQEFKRKYVPHKIDNYLFDPDEMKAEYMFACWNAIFRANMCVGNPISFCVRRGRGAMLDYYRKVSSDRLIKVCINCQNKVAYDRRNLFCKKCGADFISLEKEERMSEFTSIQDRRIHFTDLVLVNMVLEDVIKHIEKSSLPTEYKYLAIEAIKYRTDFYDHALDFGYDAEESKSFHKLVVKYIRDLNKF